MENKYTAILLFLKFADQPTFPLARRTPTSRRVPVAEEALSRLRMRVPEIWYVPPPALPDTGARGSSLTRIDRLKYDYTLRALSCFYVRVPYSLYIFTEIGFISDADSPCGVSGCPKLLPIEEKHRLSLTHRHAGYASGAQTSGRIHPVYDPSKVFYSPAPRCHKDQLKATTAFAR